MTRVNVVLLVDPRRVRAVAGHVAPPVAAPLRRARARAGAAAARWRRSTASCSSSSRRGACRRASRRSRASSCGCSCRRRRAPTSSRCRSARRSAAKCTTRGALRGTRDAQPRRGAADAAALPLAAGVRRARAAVRDPARPLAVPAVDRQRIPAGAGQRAAFARTRSAGASRPHRRPRRRGARAVDAGQVAVGVPRQVRRDAGADRRPRAHPRDHAAADQREARRQRGLRLHREAGRAGNRGARDGAAHSRACTTRTNTAASIPAAK